jgi:hypothetical protein
LITTPQLIDSLAADVKPVRRLRPPLVRAGLWLGAFVAIVAAVTWVTGAWPVMIRRPSLTRFAVEMAATFLTAHLPR